MLDHNYGLWYDLRRTDHERIRRADGDVWAPFYEQPFSRSGQGTAWDGLSRYDLTKPNKWYWARLKEFVAAGTCASDIALEYVSDSTDRDAAAAAFKKAASGESITRAETDAFKGYFTYYLMKLYAANGIRTELHVGAMRNNNSLMLAKLGLDTGYDSISDRDSINNMSLLFDKLNTEGALPRTIIFNLNPKMNAEIMTLIGCFQSDEAKGKLQYGPAWWFLDNKVGMRKHLEDLTATGHIGTFVGMLTDSRSFLSYPRHDYFRKILCEFLAGVTPEVAEKYAVKVAKDLCCHNARRLVEESK